MMRTGLSLSMFGVLATGALSRRRPRRPRSTCRPTTRNTSRSSRCATASGSSRRSMCRRTRRDPTRFDAAHALQRRAVRRRSLQGGSARPRAPDKAGYIFVFQDVRGRYLSEGDFVEMTPHIDKPQSKTDVDESTDTYDTVEWLLKNVANHNGRSASGAFRIRDSTRPPASSIRIRPSKPRRRRRR